ncbi:hypothetical protein C8R43DRAFT_593062 [Mycena crocata]|nr:hypothetical protein C8R43DRAFT_593062 [Mycena crocata]
MVPPPPVLPQYDWLPLLPDGPDPKPPTVDDDDFAAIPTSPPLATAPQRYHTVGLGLFRFATIMAMEGELPRQPADFAKVHRFHTICHLAQLAWWVGTVVEANTTLKGLLAKSDKRTVENRVGQVAEGFYVFVAAIWYATGKNKGPTLDWLASLLEPLVKAAGRSLSSNSAWYKATRIASQTIRRAAHETSVLENIHKLRVEKQRGFHTRGLEHAGTPPE